MINRLNSFNKSNGSEQGIGRNQSFSVGFSFTQHADTPFVKFSLSKWLLRLIKSDLPVSGNLLILVNWLTDGSLNELPHKILDLAQQNLQRSRKLSEEYSHILDDLILLSHATPEDFFSAISDAYPLIPFLPYSLHNIIKESLEVCTQKYSNISPKPSAASQRAWERFKKLLAIPKEARKIAMLYYWLNFFEPLNRYFSEEIELCSMYGLRAMEYMLELEEGRAKIAVDSLINEHLLVDNGKNSLAFNMDFAAFWADIKDEKLPGLFRLPVHEEILPLPLFPVEKKEIDTAIAFLMSDIGQQPIHILLYGPAGSGKSACARALATKAGCTAWSIPPDGYFPRDAAFDLCVKSASLQQRDCFIIDNADQFLDTELFSGRETTDNAWLASTLESPRILCIWTMADTSHMDPSIKRRFTFSLHVGIPNLELRIKILKYLIETVLQNMDFSSDDVYALAERYELPAGVLADAVLRVKGQIRQSNNDSTSQISTIKSILSAHECLSGNGIPLKQKRGADKHYTLDGVCFAKESGDVHLLLEKCRRADAQLKNGEIASGACTFLFYGPPGTGKTALARHIAHTVQRECIVIQASDLLDSYVGMTERNIARTFARAEKNGAVLVVDEADSFIFSRDMAHHSWESTMVNQFLTSLENYKGFCICTTNRRESMDSAAMRRFTFKIGFTWAGPVQILALYRAMFNPINDSALSESEESRLLAMKHLTPGDFNAVRNQFAFSEVYVSHAELLAALLREQRAHLGNGGSGVIGF